MPFWKRGDPADRADEVGIDIGGILLDEEGVWRPLGEGQFEGVAWDQLQAVLVETTEEGPLSGELFVVLVGDEDSGCVVPRTYMPTGFLERLALLPDFDHVALDAAIEADDIGRTVIWRRAAA